MLLIYRKTIYEGNFQMIKNVKFILKNILV